ncbi:MAG TPA: metal-dependent hydrolase, partial [Hyphomicrobiaceae bacterium]|nr:metal-dependent hydrolase [Hyphomicrobiaceae bacterium]
MANFPTHIAIGGLVAGTLATVTLAADVVAPENLVVVTVAGILGSVLPDIDLKDSRPSRAMFNGLAAFFSAAVLFTIAYKYSIVEMWIMLLGTFLLVRYGAHSMFHRMSYHRGIYHSLLAAVFFAFATAAAYKHVLGRHEGVAWLAAAFMFVGYLTHLILDEIYSVDVMDTRIKASFGTAIKPIDFKHPGHTAVMALAAAAMFMVTPSTRTFVDGMSSAPMWSALQQRLLPRDKWFGVIGPIRAMAGPATPREDTGGITTGSLPDTLMVAGDTHQPARPKVQLRLP